MFGAMIFRKVRLRGMSSARRHAAACVLGLILGLESAGTNFGGLTHFNGCRCARIRERTVDTHTHVPMYACVCVHV